MKKLLIMASLFWPQKKGGGPPVSVMNVVQSIKGRFDIYIISKNHELDDDGPLPGIQNGWNRFDFGTAYYVPKGYHSFSNIMSLIEEVKPDVIYQNSFFSMDDLLPVLIYKKKCSNVKVIVAPRGEFYPERIEKGKIKKNLYCKLFQYSGLLKEIYFQGTGREECIQEMRLLGIQDRYILNIQNISTIMNCCYEKLEKKPNELKLVYIARIHPTKNVLKAIKWLRKLSGKIQYDIYGSIEDKEYWKECLAEIEKLPTNVTVKYCGVLEHDEVPSTIAAYHAYYMPTTGENFGHSIVEAMLIGKPVVISDQTPWKDVNGNGGYVIALHDEGGFIHALNSLMCMEADEYDSMCNQIKIYITRKLNVNEIVSQYIDAFNEIEA